MGKIIMFDLTYRHVYSLAKAVKEGVEKVEGCEAVLCQVRSFLKARLGRHAQFCLDIYICIETVYNAILCNVSAFYMRSRTCADSARRSPHKAARGTRPGMPLTLLHNLSAQHKLPLVSCNTVSIAFMATGAPFSPSKGVRPHEALAHILSYAVHIGHDTYARQRDNHPYIRS